MTMTTIRKVEVDVEDMYECLVENGGLIEFAFGGDDLFPEDLTPEFSYKLFIELAKVAKERMAEEEEE